LEQDPAPFVYLKDKGWVLMLFKTAADELPYLHALVMGGEAGRERICGMLRHLGLVRLMRATSTADALGRLAETSRPVDIVVSDNGHDNSTGLALLKTIRRGEAKGVRSSMCFVMVSDVRERNMVELAVALDVHHYIVKPLTVEKLHGSIVKARSRQISLHSACYNSVLIPATSSHAWQ